MQATALCISLWLSVTSPCPPVVLHSVLYSYLCPMSLEEKVGAVEELFQKLDGEIGKFQSASGLHCKPGCGKCCFKPDIEATTLEFLPFALYLHLQGMTDAWYENLKTTDSTICLILNPTQAGAGLCSEYPHRGLICRLFGYSARHNKYGKKELITCAIIKTEQKKGFEEAESKIAAGEDVPVMSHYYMQLQAIDPDLARDYYPINIALRKAVEHVMHQVAYRD